MGFKFTFLCDLLSALEGNRILKASTQARDRNPDVQAVRQWFARHGKQIHDPDTNQVALLSCMFPEKRTDRVYWLQDTSLARVIGRCLLLGSSRRVELEKWRSSGGADLGQCVENLMRQAENHIVSGQEVTVEEIDFALDKIASRCRFSGPRVRRQRAAVDVEETLSPLYRRLISRDAKWLTRMILKGYFSVTLPEKLVLRSFHFLLPHLLQIQDSFETALDLLLSAPIRHFPPHPEPGLANDLGHIALQHLTPRAGIKIGRPDYYKARSIKHCCKMVGQRRMSVERKYDGEYCQIHVDLSKYPNSIQLFSKSGKDSTADRSGIHQTIKNCLRIGKEGCKFRSRCILEAELVVWNDRQHRIMEFHKLRKFIARSGMFIGTENDSPPQPYEHLMMVFFDILLLDDDVCLRKPHRERRLLLKNTIQIIPGFSDIADQKVIDFSRPDGQSRLESIFARGITDRWEGFILKGCEDPYFAILTGPDSGSFGCWIKLKKDYIPGLGDTIDLALIGAAYNAREVGSLDSLNQVSWTHFFIGCLVNKDAILQPDIKPKFRVLDVINRHCMSEQNMLLLNQFGKYTARGTASDHGFDIEHEGSGLPRMNVVFKTPFVVEMLGSGFEKPSGARYYTLRFPRILKIHSDRSFQDAATFSELQVLAEAAVSLPSEEIAEEEIAWANRVKFDKSMSEYLVHRSPSVTSTADSSTPPRTHVRADIQQVGSCHVSMEQDSRILESPQPRHNETIITTKNTFSIYTDRSTSSTSSRRLEHQANILAREDNLSSPSTKKRKASTSPPDLYSQEAGIKQTGKHHRRQKHSIFNASGSATCPCRGATKAGRPNSKTGSVDSLIGSDEACKEQDKNTKFPLLKVPLYIGLVSSYEHMGNIAGLPNIAHSLDEFFRMVGSQEPRAQPQACNPALGIMVASYQQVSLGETLLQSSKRLSKHLWAHAHNYPLKGRIFLLDIQFLQLGYKLTDGPFCLEETWDSVGKEYFYACIAWDPPLDENSRPRVGSSAVPQIRITFDRDEASGLFSLLLLDSRQTPLLIN